MNKSDWNHSILNFIDHDLVEQAAPARKQTTRPIRIAVIAACLCVALVGGAFAAEVIFGVPVFKPMKTSPVNGESANGFTTVIETPDEPGQAVETDGVFRHPVNYFGQPVRDLAASLEYGSLGSISFNSWAEAEEYLGVDLINNAMLNNIGEEFSATVTAKDRMLTSVRVKGVYFMNYLETDHPDEPGIWVSGTPVRVDLTVQSYTEHSIIAPDQMFMGLFFPESYTFTNETYTTPGGRVVNIVGAGCADKLYGQTTEYYAQFALNGNAVTIRASCLPNSAHALSTLKQILDAFE